MPFVKLHFGTFWCRTPVRMLRSQTALVPLFTHSLPRMSMISSSHDSIIALPEWESLRRDYRVSNNKILNSYPCFLITWFVLSLSSRQCMKKLNTLTMLLCLSSVGLTQIFSLYLWFSAWVYLGLHMTDSSSKLSSFHRSVSLPLLSPILAHIIYFLSPIFFPSLAVLSLFT